MLSASKISTKCTSRLRVFNNVRLQSTKAGRVRDGIESSAKDSQSGSEREAESTRISDEDAQVLLDRLFRKNMPTWSLKSSLKPYSRNRTFTNIQEKNKFEALDKKLLELQHQPVDFHYYLRNMSDLKSANQLPYKFGSNQLVSDDAKLKHFLRQIVWEFNAPIRYAFGYGSKVFGQGKNVDSSKSQVDMIFAVSYPDHWHSLNLHQYFDHYSWIRMLGSEAISKIGSWGAGVYFNPFVKMNFQKSENLRGQSSDFELKYGVTSVDNLIDDLTNWSTMYLSGRMQKPLAIVRDTPQISLLEQFNLVSALKLAVLMVGKPEFTEHELYRAITSMSYMGDPRIAMGGENPNKVENIVSAQFPYFRKLYLPLIQSYFTDTIQITSDINSAAEHQFKFADSSKVKAAFLSELPKSFRKKVLSKYVSKYEREFSKDLLSQNSLGRLPSVVSTAFKPVKTHQDLTFMELQDLAKTPATRLSEIPVEDWEYIPENSDFRTAEFVQRIAEDEHLAENLKLSVKQTVSRPAMIQTCKGVLTAGVLRSVQYALEKRRKYRSGKEHKQ